MRSLLAARVIYSTLFFVLASVLLVLVRPRMMFDDRTGEPKPFGLGPDCTLFSLGLVIGLLAVVTFFGFGLIDMVYACGAPMPMPSPMPMPMPSPMPAPMPAPMPMPFQPPRVQFPGAPPRLQ